MTDETGNGIGTTSAIGSGTVDGLLEFLDYLVDKGYATGTAAEPLKVASRIVFSKMQGEGFGTFDVRTFDPDDYMDRFERLVVGQYKQESLVSYRQRLKKAVGAYLEYLENGNVSAIGSGRTSRRKKVEPVPPTYGHKTNGNVDAPVPDVTASLIDYPFPLRSGTVAHLRLPMKLERTDADRLAAFLGTLVFEPDVSAGAA
jgi:hypothetical protein